MIQHRFYRRECLSLDFGKNDDIKAALFIVGAAWRAGRQGQCLIRQPCYDDFTRPASSMVKNGSSYGYFALEAYGISQPQPNTLPCRPWKTQLYVIVPPDAATDPKTIRPLTGFDPAPRKGSVVRTVYKDQGDKCFTYHDGLPGGRVYLPGEKERYYFPSDGPVCRAEPQVP